MAPRRGYPPKRGPRTPDEALELTDQAGTRSILDVQRIAVTPAYLCAAPLTADELQRYFLTSAPDVALVEACDTRWDELERGKARYDIVFANGVPAHLVFIGYSFDSDSAER